MKKIKIALFIVCATLALILLSSCGNTTINLNDYIKVSFDGYDSYGTATCTVDYDKLNRDFEGKILRAKQETGVVAMFSEGEEDRTVDASTVFNNCVEYELSQSGGLSNGDTVTVKLKVDNETAEEKYGCTFKYSDIKLKVDKLKELKDFDPFEYVTVSFHGLSDEGRPDVNIEYSDDAMYSVSIDYDYSYDLSNGDEFVVTASVYDEHFFADEYGYKLSETKKTYTVEGLSSYLKDPSDLSEDAIATIEEMMKEGVKDEVSESETLTSSERVRIYVLTPEDKDSYYYNNNYLFFVYKNDVVIKKDADLKIPETKASYYWFGYFDDVVITPDGDVDADDLYLRVADSWYSDTRYEVKAGDSKFIYSGFKTIDEFDDYLKEEYPDYTIQYIEK